MTEHTVSPSPVSSGGVPTIPTWEEVEELVSLYADSLWNLAELRASDPAHASVEEARAAALVARTNLMQPLQQLHTQALAGGEALAALRVPTLYESIPATEPCQIVGVHPVKWGKADEPKFFLREFDVDEFLAARTSRPTTTGGESHA